MKKCLFLLVFIVLATSSFVHKIKAETLQEKLTIAIATVQADELERITKFLTDLSDNAGWWQAGRCALDDTFKTIIKEHISAKKQESKPSTFQGYGDSIKIGLTAETDAIKEVVSAFLEVVG